MPPNQPSGVRPRRVRQQLSGRRAEIYALVCEGYSNPEIAARLGISVGTVKVHVADLLRIAKVRSRTALHDRLWVAPPPAGADPGGPS